MTPPAGSVELATLLSIAVRIEPALMRLARVTLLPRIDVGAEADLWFSAWVATRSPEAIVLRTDVTTDLRDKLAARLAADPGDPAHGVWNLVERVHRSSSPALLLEERVAWAAVQPAHPDIDEALRPALREMVTDPGTKVAEWFVRAWKRLPEEARSSRTAWQLVQVARSRLGRAPAATHTGDIHLVDVAALVDRLPDVQLGIARDGNDLMIGSASGTRIAVPDTNPRVLDVSWMAGGAVTSEPLQIPAGGALRLPVGAAPLWLRTARGLVYEFPRLASDVRVDLLYSISSTLHHEQVQQLWRILRASGFDAELTIRATSPARLPGADTLDPLLLFARAGQAEDIELEGLILRRSDLENPAIAILLPGDTADDLPEVVFDNHLLVITVEELSVTGVSELLYALTQAQHLSPDDAVFQAREALDALPPDHPMWPMRLTALFEALRQRALDYDQYSDIEEALSLARESLRLGVSLATEQRLLLGQSELLRLRWQNSGDPSDLLESVRVGRDAFSMQAPAAVENLSAALLERFRWIEADDDLVECVAVARQALSTSGPELSVSASALAGLSASLRERFRRHGDPADLDEALFHARSALASAPRDDARQKALLVELAAVLLARFNAMGTAEELTEAIDASRSATRIEVRGWFAHVRSLHLLCDALTARSRYDNDLADLTAAIDACRDATSYVPAQSPVRADLLVSLGTATRELAVRTGNADPLEATTIFQAAAQELAGRPGTRLGAAQLWAESAAEAGNWGSALGGYKTAVDLLRSAAWLGKDRSGLEHTLSGARALASDAAAAALMAGDPEAAVMLLENGRSLMWSRHLDLQIDLQPLRVVAPAVADRINEILHYQMFVAEPPPDRRMTLAAELDQLIAEVRALAGFESFLRPPRLFHLAAALEGPVVLLNPSRWRCDAIVVRDSGVEAIELPDLTLEAAVDQANAYLESVTRHDDVHGLPGMDECLRWMWDGFAGRVLDSLGLRREPVSGEPWPRIWWCPTGALTLLPVHAAGDHREPGSAVIDRVVSSYTPTLRALVTARTRTTTRQGDRMLIVGLDESPGHSSLPYVRREYEMLTQLVRDGEPTVMTASGAVREAVLRNLGAYSCLHFSGHGVRNADDPWRGGVVLWDGVLTVDDLIGTQNNGDLAYLSADSTATGGVNLADEAITVSAALFHTGFRHVVGTMSGMLDRDAFTVSERVYRQLLTAGRIDAAGTAQALHHSVRALRATAPDAAWRWAPFVHLGP